MHGPMNVKGKHLTLHECSARCHIHIRVSRHYENSETYL